MFGPRNTSPRDFSIMTLRGVVTVCIVRDHLNMCYHLTEFSSVSHIDLYWSKLAPRFEPADMYHSR